MSVLPQEHDMLLPDCCGLGSCTPSYTLTAQSPLPTQRTRAQGSASQRHMLNWGMWKKSQILGLLLLLSWRWPHQCAVTWAICLSV